MTHDSPMNIKRILSRTSLNSSLSTEKSPPRIEECTNDAKDELHEGKGDIHEDKDEIMTLKADLKNKETALDALVKDKDNIYLELKKSRKCYRNLYQQLIDEREIHSREKEYLLKKLNCLSSENNNNCANTSLKEMYAELQAKDEVIYNTCMKYLKIRENKSYLQRQMDKLKHKNHKICQHIIMLLEKNREALDILMDKLTATTIPKNDQEYLKLLRINGQLEFENTQLKVSLTSMGVERINSLQEQYCDTHRNASTKIKNLKKITTKKYVRLHKSNHTVSLASDPLKTRFSNKNGKLCLRNKIISKSLSELNIF